MTEVRALLFIDVVDSTELASRLGDARMAALWAAHDRIARDLLQAWRGREIDKTDGLLAMFESAADAAGYALAYHRALAALEPPLAARAGLDIGPVVLRENSSTDIARGAKALEVEGMVKPIAARIMPIARGGQTLVTARLRQALGATSLRVESHGHWRLKGLAEPLELFEIGDEHAAFVPPAAAGAKAHRVVRHGEHWLPVEQVRHNLPAERDDFVDRQASLLDLAQRFDAGARLVSVLGIGGCGKTRLATRFAWTWLGDFAGGAWFCDLSQARSAEGVVRAVAEALEVPLGNVDGVSQLGSAIAGRGHCLIVLDNFEQVARHAEETLGRWLDRAREARFLATTREVLGLPGEESLALAPLRTPDAATLFMRRAQAANSDFRPSAADKSAIEPLVQLLDGLPLAIELAAARVRVMPPRALLARMSERFKLLSSSGGRQDRQATLRAAFDWSWDLLSVADKAALAQLSVFEGGFTLESAEAVLDLSAYAGAPWPTDAVQSLHDKSFVRALGDHRFDLLGTVQEYAAEHLRTAERYPGSGAAALAAAQARHGAHFAQLGEPAAIAERCVEMANLICACRRAVQRGDATVALGALDGAWAALHLRGPFAVGVELAAAVCAIPALEAVQLCRAERVCGDALDACGRVTEARARFESALLLARAVADRRCEARVLCHLCDLHRHAGQPEAAESHVAAALALVRELDDPLLLGEAQNALGSLRSEMGQMDEALLHYEAALAVVARAGDRRWEGGLRGNIGNIHATLGRMDEAEAHYAAALQIAREVGDRQWEGNMLCNLGYLNQTQGRLDAGRAEFEAALNVAREMGHARLECIVLCNLGLVFDSLAQLEQARDRYEAALAVARQLQDRRSEGQILGYLGLLHAREKRFDAARECLDSGERALRQVADRASLGVLLCNRAEAEQLAGASDAAQRALAQAEEIADDTGTGAASEFGLLLARARERVGPGRA